MEKEKQVRSYVRRILSEFHESANHSEELLQDEEESSEAIEEKNILDDRHEQGSDKITSRLNAKS